MNSHHNKSTTP